MPSNHLILCHPLLLPPSILHQEFSAGDQAKDNSSVSLEVLKVSTFGSMCLRSLSYLSLSQTNREKKSPIHFLDKENETNNSVIPSISYSVQVGEMGLRTEGTLACTLKPEVAALFYLIVFSHILSL